METLEQHLNTLEGKKTGNSYRSAAPSPMSKASPATTVSSPSSTPAKSIDTTPAVDLFASPSSAATPKYSISKLSSDLLDLQPDFTSTVQPAAAAAAAPAASAWGDLLGEDTLAVPAPANGSEAQPSDPFVPELTPTTTTAADTTSTTTTTTSTSAPAPAPAAPAATAEVDLFGG
uniref:Synaptosome associated protein 91 n=1 Tax=Latimeria chalumnae TaxID=7897 RepID=H3B7R9_LATCH